MNKNSFLRCSLRTIPFAARNISYLSLEKAREIVLKRAKKLSVELSEIRITHLFKNGQVIYCFTLKTIEQTAQTISCQLDAISGEILSFSAHPLQGDCHDKIP